MSPGEGSLFPGLLGRDGFQRLGHLRLAFRLCQAVEADSPFSSACGDLRWPLRWSFKGTHMVVQARHPCRVGNSRRVKRHHSCKCSTWMKPVLTPPHPGLQSREACKEPRQEGWTRVHFSGLRTCPLAGSGNSWGRGQALPLCIPAWTGSEQKHFV